MKDVMIVGAGPSGGVAALVLARAGRRVLVIERKSFPREKVCGDCLNPKARRFWKRLGLEEGFQRLPKVAPRELTLEWYGVVQACLPLGGMDVVSRAALDAWLLDEAQRAGAEVWTETTLLERIGPEGWKTSKGEVQAKWVIGADGRNSTVARLAGLSRRLKREASVRVGWMANFAEWTTSELRLGAFTKGCYGLAPRVDGGTHACVVLPPEERPERWVRELFGVQETAEWQNLSPLTRAPFGPGGEGVLLAGDAHRVLEPFTGEGIWHALQSGEAAARALLDDTENPGPGYCAALREIYGRHLWVNDLSRWTLESPARASVVFPLLKRFPPLAAWLGKAVLR